MFPRSRNLSLPSDSFLHFPTHNSRVATFDLTSPGTTPSPSTFWISSRSQTMTPAIARASRPKSPSAHRRAISYGSQLPTSVSHFTNPLDVQSHAKHSIDSPVGDPPKFQSEAHKRRQKMDKLNRILGEPIPPQLVFPCVPEELLMMEFVNDMGETPETVVKKRQFREPATNLSRPSTAPRLETASFSPSSANTWVGNGNNLPEIRRRSSVSVKRRNTTSRPSTASQLETSPFTPRTLSQSVPSAADEARWFGQGKGARAMTATGHVQSHDRSISGSSSFSDGGPGSTQSIPGDERDSHRSSHSVTGKEGAQRWSGEWNCDDMQQVISKLRRLK